MNHSRFRPGIGLAGFAVLAGGCTGVSETSTLQDLLNASGLGAATIGDVLAAIQDFGGNSASVPFGQTLTEEQDAELASLREQYNAGAITLEEYASQAAAIIGPVGPGMGFGGGHGREFGPGGFPDGAVGPRHGMGGPADQLDLSVDQQTQAQAIFDAMRADIIALQNAAQADIDAVLTDEQRAMLDEIDVDPEGGHARAFGPALTSDWIAEQLGLTTEQRASIQTILGAFRDAADARRAQAEEEFRAILTEAQLAQLDENASAHGPRRRSEFRPG